MAWGGVFLCSAGDLQPAGGATGRPSRGLTRVYEYYLSVRVCSSVCIEHRLVVCRQCNGPFVMEIHMAFESR